MNKPSPLLVLAFSVLFFAKGIAIKCYTCSYIVSGTAANGTAPTSTGAVNVTSVPGSCEEETLDPTFLEACPAGITQCWIINVTVPVGATRQREISRLCAPGQVVASSECGAKGDGVACACDTDGCNDSNTEAIAAGPVTTVGNNSTSSGSIVEKSTRTSITIIVCTFFMALISVCLNKN